MRSLVHPLLLVAVAGAAIAASAPAPGSPPTDPAKSGAAAAARPSGAPVLQKGMTEEQIIAAIGRPQETKVLKVPAGSTAKAETWIYRRTAGTRQVREATGTRSTPAFKGGVGNDSTGSSQEIIYTVKTITTYRVTSLLMVDGKLELARQTTEQEEHY